MNTGTLEQSASQRENQEPTQPRVAPAISSKQFLAIVALFPALAATALAILIHLSIPFNYDRPAAATTDFASITMPADGDTVSNELTMRGSIFSTEADIWLYLAEESEGRYYPKTMIDNTAGPWQTTLYSGAPAGNEFRVVLLGLSAEQRLIVDNWFQHGSNTGEYPGIDSFELDVELAGVKLVAAP